MPPREITPVQALAIIAERMQKRIAVLKSVGLNGYSVAISELDIFHRQVVKAKEYFAGLKSGRSKLTP